VCAFVDKLRRSPFEGKLMIILPCNNRLDNSVGFKCRICT